MVAEIIAAANIQHVAQAIIITVAAGATMVITMAQTGAMQSTRMLAATTNRLAAVTNRLAATKNSTIAALRIATTHILAFVITKIAAAGLICM